VEWFGDLESNHPEISINLIQDLSLTAAFQRNDQTDLFGKVRPISKGWSYLPWFGVVFLRDDGWMFHQEHGWLWVQNLEEGKYWVWDHYLGWIFVDIQHHNWMYWKERETMIWLEKAIDKGSLGSFRYFWIQDSQKWMEIPVISD